MKSTGPWLFCLFLGLPCAALAQATPPCPEDALLSQAAAELMLTERVPDANALLAAVHEAGSDAVGVKAIWLSGSPQDRARRSSWLAGLRDEADAPVVCGEAISQAGRLLLASARGGSLQPVSAQDRVVRGSLAEGFEEASLVIHAADGQLTSLKVTPGALRDGVPLSEELELPARVQLLARGRAGPRPVAERSVGRSLAPTPGASPPAAEARAGKDVPIEAAQSALRRLRGSEGRSTLRANALLSRLADSHAQQVCKSGRVAHELEPGADPEMRLREAGVVARRVGETVARSSDLARAFDALSRSPSHRMTLLEPGFTDVGLGSARDADGKRCLVVLLAAWPRYVGR